jgi:UTP--glucose-1-phosphate uridylyltransferase
MMQILQTAFRKVVIPAAGMGRRLLPATKEIPKEMLPIAIRNSSGIILKPILQGVYEQLYSVGLREFCFIIGRGKREIEDHFSPDWTFLENVEESIWRTDLERFFKELETSRVYFVNQARRRGFGDAVLHSEKFVDGDSFVIHAGDDLVLSRGGSHLLDLARTYYERNADAVLMVQEVDDPSNYGVVVGKPISQRVVAVREIEEKPQKPKSRLAVIAIYAFSSTIFDAIKASRPDSSGELQLTSAIQLLLEQHRKVLAVKLRPNEVRIDIGNPESYIHSLTHAPKGLPLGRARA